MTFGEVIWRIDAVHSIQQSQVNCLQCLSDYLPWAIDITEIAYHGQHEEDDAGIRRGKATSRTTHFHCYATLYRIPK
jgi:hypothetical protein